ncbi:CD209 antigen-like protein E [Cottoperca gobio]|uniref:CD209 antigen-like protein E n=1 Tax=Cottoperca gobio TaxID=56716 RepID=A0A6J2S0V2_COTGO|nr:CD209 antigen-like protein E [Cottoperca gobio]
MEEHYVNVETDPRSSTKQMCCRSERTFVRAVLLSSCAIFLLVVIIRLSFHYRDSAHCSAAELSTMEAKLTSMTEERDRLTASLTEMTRELDRLQCLSQKKTCPAGWRMFSCACYLFSNEARSWDRARQDCRQRGADLVVINSDEEQTFLFGLINQDTWIGLNDRDEEGTWKWVDGTPLTQTPVRNWGPSQPDSAGNEDCASIRHATKDWNDRDCEHFLLSICEKTI